MNNRCDCGAALVAKPLHQRASKKGTDKKGRKTFTMHGEYKKVAGKKLVCPKHGVKKIIYD